MDQKEFDAILKSHKHAEESPGDIAERIIGMGQPKRTIGGTLKDIGVTSVNAVIGAGEALVGLADLATGGMAGKGLSQLGYDPKAARNFLQQYKSEAQQAADRRVDEAKGFGGTLKAYLQNPSTIVEAGAESLPSMFLGGGIGRGIGAAGKAAGILSNPAARAGLLGAIGEGVVGAGSAAEQIRQETGELTGKGAASAIGSGVGTGVLGRLGNKLAPKLGAVDIEEALVRGFSGNARNVPLSFGKTLKAITGGAISEGAFEELPQSIQEQVWQNYATGKPLMEGVPEGAAQGLVTGAAMGGAVNIHSALPGQQRKALAELEQKRQAELAQEHDKLVREATRGQVALQAATGQNLPGVSSAGLNFDGGSGLPPGVAPYMAGQNASTFDLMREQQQRQAQTALDLEQRQQAAREQVLQQERIQNQLAANGFGYAPGQRAAVHGAPDEMASALAGETEEEYQQRLGNLEHRRQQGQQGLINVLQNRVDMQRQNAQATAGAIAKAAQAAKQQENEQAQRDRFDQWAAAERAAGRDVGPFSMDEQQQAKATSSGPLGKAAAKGFGALNEAERAVEYGRIFDRGATNTQAIEQIQAERERAFLGDGESSDAGLPEFRQELAANRRERVAQGLPATLTPDAKAAATIEGVDFRQQPGSKLPPELDYQVSRMEAQLQESITGTHEANVDQNGDTVWLKGKGYWPQWMEKKTMPRGKWAKQGTQEREDQAEALKNANILHDAGRDKILAVIDKARKGVALGSHEKSIWSAVERIASQPGGPALWGQSDMLIADANEAAANERMQARYGLSMLPKPMTVRVADIEPGETLAVDGMVEDVAGKTVLYTHKGIDAQGNTIMERGEHDAVTGKTGAARVMRFEPTDHLEGVIGVRERADREQSPNRTTKAYNREGKAFRSIEKQGIAITEPQNIPVDMLRPGDRVVIRDPQGMPDVATMRGYDSNNRAVIRDGIEYHLQADDNITVEGFRAKGEVRQTKGFGYRPKNERQQIAREYEQDRQERAERSEILREAKTQVRGELTNTLRQIAGKRRIHAEEQRALATQANKRQQAGADSKQGTPQAVMPKGSRPTVSLGYGFHPGDNTPTLERARAQKQEQKENRKTFPGTQYETGEQRVRENRRNFPATKYETGKPGRIEREAFARPTGYQQVKPAASALRENKRQSGLARQQEGEARPQGIIRGGTDNDRALAHEQYQAVLDFAAGKLRRENAGLSTREARRQAIQQLGLEEKAVPETGWWRERAGKSPGYLANLLSKSAAKRTKTAEAIHVEHSSGSNPYFLSTEKSTIVPLKDLLSSEPKLDAARVDRARANMDAAAAGTGAKRKPLPVYRRSDGKLVALDGNSTLAVLRERGEKSAIVEIKKTIKQPRATLDEIYADAAKADVVLRKSLADFVERTGGRLVSRPDGQIKSRERAEQKARQDNTPRKLKDIVAHTLVYPDQKTLMQALPQFEKEYGPIELKNRFENPPDSGYRDILANVRVKEADGHIAEIQLTTEAMLQAKEGLGHKIYEVQRELDDIAKRTNNTEATELALEFDKISKEYYEAAAQSSNSSKSASASSSALFRLTLSPDLNKTLARASELLVSMNSSPNIRKSVLDLESSLKGVPSQSKYRSSMESSPVAEEKSSGSGENIQQKAAQSEENQAPAGKTEAREAAAPGKPEVPVILPPGSFRNEKVEITKRGRKWLKGKRVGKNYEIKIEINDVSRDWQAGQTVEFPAHVEVEQSKYGITTTSYPLTAEQVAQARVQAVLPDIKRWLGYVEEKAHEGHVYQNGVQKLRELGIASLPEYQKRLDAALASVKERKEAEATREASEGRTWLRVPYADKDHAKKHGARFDGDRKQWYVIGKDVPEALEQYLPDDSGGGRPNDKRPGNGQPEQKEAGQYTISNGSGYGGSPYKTGETIRSNRKDLPEYVTVIRASQRYYGEDGMSFGVGDDSGYVYTATVREATREEAAPVRAREEAKKARKQAKEILLSIAREIRENGDRPELQGAPAGVRIDMPGNPENIHGGGEWFVIGQDRVWHVRNNGADGDDWSANNIRTGGAGAIGFAIPFDRGLAGRLVGALEAAGADIPQAARKLTEGESGPRESRAAGGDVVATLNGEEVLSATGETIFEKARNYYRDNLQGKDVYREGLGAVRVTGKGWGKLKRGLKTDELKARLIPGIPALIRDGAIGAREPVIREDGIVAFYHITGNVRIGDEIVQAGISVGEDGFGNLFYNMNHDTEVLWEKRKARLLPRSEAGGGEPSTDNGLSVRKSIGDQIAFVNLHVLSRAEEQQTKALPESERADIEGELITAIGKLQTRRLFGSMGQVKILDTQDDAQRVIASGQRDARHSKGGAIQGITMPDGQVYLVRDGIAKGQAMPVLLHELGEHAAQLGFKDMQYRAILRSMERQAKDDSETGRAIRKGIARARAAGVRPDNKYYWSEVAAYTIEENADVHTSLLDRIVNYFKGLFLKVCGVQAGKFSHKDLVMFAKAAAKAAARRGAQFGKYDPQKSLWSADESQTGLRSISETGAQREYDEVVKRYKGTAQWLKAPNGKPSNLNERQWVQVRTPSFKKWFGDWESLATARAIRDLVPVDAANVQEISSKKDIENYFRNNSAVTNTRNGVTVSFPIATAGKIYHHKGLPVGRIVGRLKEIFEHSIPFLSEKEELKEGHKAHPNIDSFDHYVGKVSLGEGAGGGEYYVRFTVRKEVVGKKGNTPRQETHNVAVSDVQIYEKPDAANLTGNTPGEGSQPAFVDSKLRDFFAKVKSEEVSKVLDANGEPLVVYHAVGSYYRETGRDGFTVFDRSLANVGFMFSDNKAFAEVWGTGDGALAGGYKEVFLNIKNPFELDAEGAPWSSIPNPMLQDGWDLEDILEEARQDKPLGDNMRDGGNKITVDGASYYFEKYRKPIEDEESGLIVRNVNEALSSNIDVVTDYIAFSPSQIKSATDNTGDFDSENPDIRYSFAGEKGAAESREDITNQAKDYGRRIREAAAKWASVVDQAIKDIQRNKKPSKPLEVGPTPDLLVQLGIPDLRVVMGLSVVNKIMFKKHGLTAEQAKALYEEMSDPVAVVRYGEEDYAVVTGMKKGDSPIIVGLNVGDGHQIHVNTITSAYGKDGFKGYMIGKAQDGQIVYLDKKKLAGLVERTIPGGDISQTQFLGGFQQDLQRAIRGKIKYPSDVVKPQFEESAPTKKAGEITTLFQTAYHGSPYRFSGFTLENIGGGEGAQVHGWGLYFALDRDVSEGYLAKLGDDNPAYKTIYGSGVKTNDGWIWADESDPENGWTLPSGSADDIALEAMEDAGGVQKDAISALEERLEDLRDDIDLELEEGEELEDALKENEEYQNVLEALGFLRDVEYERTSSGQLYEVDIPDDDVMLREDAALEEQPEQVREAVKKLFAEHGLDPDDASNGREIYEKLARTLGGDEDASRALNEAGVKGIRYDGRDDGECAVVFDDKAIEILDTFYQAEAQGSLDDVLKQLYGQIMKSGESRNARTPWTEKTSKAIIMGPHGSARKSNESLYRAAKEGGDPKAAYELVAPLVTKEGVDAIRAKLRDVTSAVVVPVVSEERLGRNKIPRAYADILADRLGAQVAVDIVHINKVNRSGSDGFHRLAAQPEFDGAVEAGREYIIVDDTLAQGGTLASLKGYIEQKGGRVVAISALTGKDYSAKLRPNTADLAVLRKKYPELEAFWYEEFGYGFDRLTSSEANYLCTVKGHTFDTIRDRILAERRQGGASNHSGSDSTGQSGGQVSGSLDSKSRFPSFKSAGKGDGANPSSDSGHSSSRTRFQQVREQINRILPNKDEAKAIIAIIEARAFSAGLTPEEFVTKRGLTFVDAELPVNPQGKLLEKMMGGQLRGAFNVRDYVEEGRAIITAFRGNANVSTLAHELGHLFRQDLKRYGQDRLLAMAEHWAGVKNGRWNREQEEKFARGFEAYLLEGKAPTTAMGKVFERFRVWISRLYGALVGSQLNVGLDDEIRSVFDALLTEHAAEDAGDAFAEGIAKTRARIAELEGSGPIDLDHRTLFQIGLADSGGAGNTFTGWTSAINRIMSSHPKWRDRWERFIYNMVDTNDPRERIWKAAGSPDAQDIVTVERLRGKKAAAEQKTFRDGMVTPLLKSMAAAGLKASDLEEYAHAMHAPERNQRMREVNAKRVLESLLRQMPAKDADEYRELINLAQSGLRQGWDTTDVQRFYLDQMQKIFNDLSAREQQCNALARTATSNAAQQRVAKMQEQIAESYRIRDKWRTESQRFAGITDGEAQSIVAKWRQDKRFAAIEDARQQLSAISRATLDTLHEAGEIGDEEYQALRNGYQYYVPLHRDGFQDTRPATGRVTGPTGRPFKVAKGSMLEVVNILPEVIRAHETAINRKHKLEAGRALYEFALAHPDAGITVEKQEQMPTHDREGNIAMYTRQTEPEDGVFVKVDGKRYLLRFEADVRTPEGRTLARFLDSIKGQDAQLGGITKSLHKITRLLAAVNTSLSPEFVVSNFSRDLQTALMHLNQEDINMQGLQSQVLKSVGKAVRGIWLAERGKPGNNEMARWYRDFEKNGGKVGWVQNYDGIEDLSKKLAGEMKLYEPGNRARKITRAVLDFIDAGNVAIENALRLATYKAMVEKGIDRAKAAGIASNLTVDFTRKGKLSPQINALYMFFNASVQGGYRMAKALATSPRVRKIAGGIAASGFLLQMLALAGGGDDDSDEPYVLGLPDSTRERYILIPMPGQDGRFFKFPKAYGYGALYDLGAEVANSMYMGMTGRQYNHAKGAMRVVSSFANSFNPIQSATILQTIAPTLVDPFVYVGENTNWTGLPLRPAQNNFGPKKPESGRAWKNTNPIYKSIAEGVNSLTGGDRYESGLVDISPEVFEMAVNTALGGLGRFIGNTAALPLATAKGELDAEKIPFVRQVYAKWDDRALSNRYYEAMERAQIARMRFKNAETLAEKRSIFDSPEYKIWRQSNAMDKQVKRLRARLNRMEAAGNTVGADYLRKQIVGLQSKVLSTIM